MTIQTGAPRPRAAALRAFEAGGNRRRGLADRPDCGRSAVAAITAVEKAAAALRMAALLWGFARIGRRGAKDML